MYNLRIGWYLGKRDFNEVRLPAWRVSHNPCPNQLLLLLINRWSGKENGTGHPEYPPFPHPTPLSTFSSPWLAGCLGSLSRMQSMCKRTCLNWQDNIMPRSYPLKGKTQNLLFSLILLVFRGARNRKACPFPFFDNFYLWKRYEIIYIYLIKYLYLYILNGLDRKGKEIENTDI